MLFEYALSGHLPESIEYFLHEVCSNWFQVNIPTLSFWNKELMCFVLFADLLPTCFHLVDLVFSVYLYYISSCSSAATTIEQWDLPSIPSPLESDHGTHHEIDSMSITRCWALWCCDLNNIIYFVDWGLTFLFSTVDLEFSLTLNW